MPESTPAPQSVSTKKKNIPWIFLGIAAAIIIAAFLPSSITGCVYTEADVLVPENLLQGKFVTIQNISVANGIDPDNSCLPKLGNVSHELVSPEGINNPTIGISYYTRGGRTVSQLPKGKVFHLKSVTAVTKHGISTIDSGSGPIHYLILADDDGIEYKIATVELGFNKGGEILELDTNKGTLTLDGLSFSGTGGTFAFPQQ